MMMTASLLKVEVLTAATATTPSKEARKDVVIVLVLIMLTSALAVTLLVLSHTFLACLVVNATLLIV